MTTPRIFRKRFSPAVVLTPDELKHIVTVLRLKNGEPVEVACAEECALYLGRLEIQHESVSGLELAHQSSQPGFDISLALPLLKGGGVEQVIDEATQLGIREINIFEAEHSVVRFAGKLDSKKHRFALCAESAAAQSKQLIIPTVRVFTDLQSLLQQQSHKKIICCAIEEKQSLAEQGALSPTDRYLIVTGPEGDFSAAELQLLKEQSHVSISLGPTILRANLAPIVALVQTQYRLHAGN